MSRLRLRVALRRGALTTAANWPLVAVGFVADSLYKAALGVPVVGGAVMVAALAGDDVASLLSQGLRAGIAQVFASLMDAPVAMGAFATAITIVGLGGAVFVFLVQAGSVAVLVAGERHAPDDLNVGSVRRDAFRLAHAFSLEAFLSGVDRFGRRLTLLGAALIAAYLVTFVAFGLSVLAEYRVAAGAEWISAFPLMALLTTSALAVGVAAINLLYLLMQIIIVAEDCSLPAALTCLRRFLTHDARQVAGIFGVILTMVVVGTAVSILATAALGLIAWVPFVGLAVMPLQAAFWLARGLVFQFIDFTALTAYLAQYRRFAEQE